MTQNVSWGVIISTRSLVLQRVGRYHSGMYACSAANDRGETQSSLVSLRIHCKYNLEHKYQIPMKAFHIHQNKNSNVQSKNNQNLFVKIIVMLNEGYFSISQFIFLSFSLSLSLTLELIHSPSTTTIEILFFYYYYFLGGLLFSY